ncbi:hypothetical protein SAMN04487995_4566 [Dyadobacter koreensis]|uniref:Uncharacterized protein n=1 Tax=Dyadobacter koreensis TaxID=408657 RepID=A0A1H6YR59_9BACT|nr:hypothetical protein SAMN04487995_4566 [Dyadobacter koreensis]
MAAGAMKPSSNHGFNSVLCKTNLNQSGNNDLFKPGSNVRAFL